MDRRRLEDSHLKFAVLQVVMWYPEALQLEEFPLSTSVNETQQIHRCLLHPVYTKVCRYKTLFWMFVQQ